ncbi:MULTISPECIES: beta-ketoacyl synthase chain length factor [unclassified Campylobacter]|uniref:beta-ketoacyl synthase chain length factor n=1 Tax=unclassified Campylobacter TaxID=2593542 RepID=UPI0022E9D374|nr:MULTISPECIES: beta-ketoacyl synthase chain length factor [unclassified Campylobacter]MDA3081210.1 beta-ketoacyl synthase chain length factor [Campylobacter sp. CS_NA1]MDA3085761.1 beta-ketoacyl synthase chain length factor [Campylobacter sp. CS_ED1]MDA3090191.1 beta-ketoacyl synthase chain length factor [Campylobacter sp. CS_ED2]
MQNKVYFNISKFDAIIDTGSNLSELEIYKKSPDLTHITPIERRRLSKGARFCISLLKECDEMPVIFSSKHGEINRCFSLQSSLARLEPLSPASFCISVHNAIVAQNAIFAKNRAEISAVSANLSLENGILNAVTKFDEFDKIAIISYFESINNELMNENNLIYAILVVVEKGKNFSIKISPNNEPNLANLTKNSDFEFLLNLKNHKKSWVTKEQDLSWKWCNETAI